MKKIVTFLLVLGFFLTACTAFPSAQKSQPQATSQPLQAEAIPGASLTTGTVDPAPTPLPLATAVSAIENPSIIDLEMLDENHGWGITESAVILTEDGGITWKTVTPPDLTDVGYSVFPFFWDSTHAWIQMVDPNNYPYGGLLYHTADGGRTWDTYKTPFSAGDMAFVDEQNGWMMADLGVGAGSMAVAVFQTNNGGKTWNRTYTNDPNIEGAGESLPLGGLKVMLVPLNMNTAYIGGVVYSSGTTYIFRTDDSGRTWSHVEMKLPADAQSSALTIEQISFPSPRLGFVSMRWTSNSMETRIFVTQDGGGTWTSAPFALPKAGKIEIPSQKEIIYYYDSQFFISTDSGNTFEVVAPNIAFGESLSAMSFANSTLGWVVTTSPTNQRILYKTTDGAHSWVPVFP